MCGKFMAITITVDMASAAMTRTKVKQLSKEAIAGKPQEFELDGEKRKVWVVDDVEDAIDVFLQEPHGR